MSYLTMTGQLINTFLAPVGISKKTGEEYGGQDKIQLLADLPLPDGGMRNELITLTTHEPEQYEQLKGQKVRVPVGAFATGKVVQFFIQKGSKPELVGATPEAKPASSLKVSQ